MKSIVHFTTPGARRLATVAATALLAVALARAGAVVVPPSPALDDSGLPLHLRDTGLYANSADGADAGRLVVSAEVMSFTPQYPLWSDGASKRRWLYLPPGSQIDARDPDAWEFPPGTKLWKEFAYDRAIETRYIERRQDGSWRYAAYVWNADGSDAVLAPARGMRDLPAAGAPDGRYEIPARFDCTACHEGAASPVLGFSALQLSSDRDAGAVHATSMRTNDVDLRKLIARGLIRNLPPALIERAPAIAATSATERAALGYLHGNCGHCHNDNGSPAPVGLVLAQQVDDRQASTDRILRSAVNVAGRYRPAAGAGIQPIIKPARPDESVLPQRMRSRHAATQMPPLGTRTVDMEGVALIERWISQLNPQKEQKP
jgi:mono/diheme cytochrome c family protein